MFRRIKLQKKKKPRKKRREIALYTYEIFFIHLYSSKEAYRGIYEYKCMDNERRRALTTPRRVLDIGNTASATAQSIFYNMHVVGVYFFREKKMKKR